MTDGVLDVPALALMRYQWGQRLTVIDPTAYHNGYQITAREVVSSLTAFTFITDRNR